MDIPLDNNQVSKIAGKTITLVLNSDMEKYEKILDLFASDYVLINYLIDESYGHWVGLHLDRDNNKITYFDSYGKLPDEARLYIPMKYRIESNQYYPHLARLMEKWIKEDGGTVHYNDEQLQRYSKNIQTCGRWVGYFFRCCDDVTVEEFEESFIDNAFEYIIENNIKGIEKDLILDKAIVDITDNFL